MAAEQRAEADRDRQDAARRADPGQVYEDLAAARRGQEEVERSLGSLLQDLEPWSSSQELSGEASRLAQEQKDLQARLEELAKGLNGKPRDELSEEQCAELDAAQEKQKRLTQRATDLIKQMKEQAEQRAEKDAETAAELKKAAQRAEAGDLTGRMKAADEKIGANQLNAAGRDQREALAELAKLQRDLKDSREARLDRLARKMKEEEARAEELFDEQEKLQRKIREAAKINDPEKRREELQRLARQQEELQRKTREAAERVGRAGNQRGRQALEQAAEEMKDAVKQLSRTKPDDDKQEDVLDRLDDARREMQQARKKAEEELGREQIVRAVDTIRRLRERQEGLLSEAARIQDDVRKRGNWSRGLRASLGSMADAQRGLSEETESVVKKDLNAVPVFATLLRRAGVAMAQAAERAAAIARRRPRRTRCPMWR